MEIEIKVSFFGGKGHCNVTVIPSDYETTRYEKTRSFFFELPKGSYNLQLQGVSAERVLVEVINPEGKVIGIKEIKKEGAFMRSLDVEV
jgi:hypothetical protein